MKKNLILSLSLLSFFATIPGYCQWNSNSTVNNPICVSGLGQTNPIPIISDGGAIIVWDDYYNSFPYVFAQKISEQGYTQWTENGVNTNFFGVAARKAISDGGGGVCLLHAPFNNNTGMYDLKYQRIGINGNLWMGATGFTITSQNSFGDQPQYESDFAGGITTTYKFGGGSTPGSCIRVSGCSGLGVVFTQSLPSTNGYCSTPLMYRDNNNGFFLVGIDYTFTSEKKVYIHHITENTAINWLDKIVLPFNIDGQNLNFKAITDLDNNLVIVYQAATSPSSKTRITKISQTGDIIYDHFVNELSASGEFYPQIFKTSTNDVIVAYGTTNGENIIKLDDNGNYLWNLPTVLPLNLYTSPDENYSKYICGDGNNGLVLTYSLNSDIFAQRIDSNGSVLFSSSGLVVCNQTSGQSNPTLMYNSNDMTGIIAWQDLRNGTAPISSLDVYASKVSFQSNLNNVQLSTKPNLFYPNPCYDKLHFNIDSSINLPLKSKIYDSTGKKITSDIIFSNYIDTSNLKKGMYLLYIENQENSQVIKFIKQ